MKGRGRFLLVAAMALALALGMVSSTSAITNGQPDAGAHPYVGLLVFDVDGVPTWRCTGALLSPTVVLTAGHCTEGATAARAWFAEDVQGNPDYPAGGPSAIEGTPYMHPGFCTGCGNGLPGFAVNDVGVVVLDAPAPVAGPYAQLPAEGLVDTLANKTGVTAVGYGVQTEVRGGGPPYWTGLKVRLVAPSELVSGKFVHSDQFMRLSLNASQGKGGTCFGDSGGPDLLDDTNTVLAVNSYVTNYNCAGVGYSNRVDTADALSFINGFLSP